METCLDNITHTIDGNLVMYGYQLISSNHPGQYKGEGVCINYNNPFPLKFLNVNYLWQNLTRIVSKICKIFSSWKILKKYEINFWTFFENNPFLVASLGDIYVKL